MRKQFSVCERLNGEWLPKAERVESDGLVASERVVWNREVGIASSCSLFH